MSTLLNKASLVLVPSGYKEDIVYSQIPTNGDGDLTFTRASDATRVNSAGLVERVPYNLASDSNSFPFLSGITKTTGQNDPFGSTNGNLLTATGTGEHYAQPTSLTAIVGNAYTFSVYGKFVQGVNFALRTVFANGNSDISTIWNLSTGAIVLNATDHTNPTITSVGNGWYRCSITYTPATVPAFPLLFRVQMAIGTNLSFTATSGDGFLAYGAQINEGTLKPYFPTTDRLNVPRLDYSGGSCPSLLLEKQSTNLVTYSEQFDNAAWSTANTNGTITRTANYGISPDGTQNADRIQFTRGSGVYDYAQTYQQVLTTSGTHTFSCWMKSLSGTPSIGWAYNGSVWDVVTLTNEWVRYTWTTTTNTNPSANFIIYGSLATPLSADFLVWGYQIEASSYATSYIPTTSSAATRVADAAYKTGISSLIGQTEGTIYAEGSAISTGSGAGIGDSGYLFAISDNTLNNQISIRLYPLDGKYYLQVRSGGSFVVGTVYTPTSVGQNVKIAIAYKTNDFVFYANGTQIGTASSGAVPALSTVNMGQFGGVLDCIVNTKQALVFKTRLTNSELASLTGNQNYTINQAYASYGVASESPNCVQP